MSDEKTLFIHKQILRRHPSTFLLAVQLLSLFLYAAFDGTPGGQGWFVVFGALVVLLVVLVVKSSPAVNWIAWILAGIAAVLWIMSRLRAMPSLEAWASLLVALLYLYAAGSLIAYMMEDYRVTVDELSAAGATFTLIAWAFAHLYLVCQYWLPGSFTGGMISESQTFFKLLFLSFANLTATGLSDIVPFTSAARALVMLEQFAGVAYLAVVVSRLVGMTIVRQNREREP